MIPWLGRVWQLLIIRLARLLDVSLLVCWYGHHPSVGHGPPLTFRAVRFRSGEAPGLIEVLLNMMVM